MSGTGQECGGACDLRNAVSVCCESLTGGGLGTAFRFSSMKHRINERVCHHKKINEKPAGVSVFKC
jgi:hypothetical protein